MKSICLFSQPTIVSVSVRHAMLLGSILLLAASLSAQEDVQADWVNPIAGKYSVATNWSTGTVPNNDASFVYSVTINQGTVFSDQDATINALTIGANGALWDHVPAGFCCGRITTGTIVNDGTVDYARGGRLTASSVLINRGRFNIGKGVAEVGDTNNSGSMSTSNFDGAITVNGTLTNTGQVSVGTRLVVNGDFINDGMVTSSGQPGTSVISGNICNNKDGAYLFGVRDAVSGIVHNHGIMRTPRSSFGVIGIGSLDNDGILQIANRVNVGEISNAGTMGFGHVIQTRSFTQNNEGIWQEQQVFGFGTLTATDYIALDGTLDLSPLASVHFTLGQTFDLATFPPGNLNGSFSTIVGNTFSSGTLMLQINYDENAGRIRLTVVPAGSQEVIFTPVAS